MRQNPAVPAERTIVDAHSDLLLELAVRAGEDAPFARRWLPKLEAGGVRLQVCALYAAEEASPAAARAAALAQADAFARAVRENEGSVVHVCSAADLGALDGRLGLMLSLEGAEPLDGDADAFDELWGLGVRMLGLTWNRRNAFAGGIDDAGAGLTAAGARLVERCAELGAVIDLAHASPATFADVLAKRAPVAVSHANCRAVHAHPRNLGDDQLRALAARGGVLGVMADAIVVDPERPTVDRLVDHVDHAVATMGIAHVGLGADFLEQVLRSGAIGGSRLRRLLRRFRRPSSILPDLAGPNDYPGLVETLRARGYDGDGLRAILGANFLRLLAEALPRE